MKKEDLISFMKEIAAELQQRGNLGTAHVYRSSLNAIRTFWGSDRMLFRQLTPEWLKRFENTLRMQLEHSVYLSAHLAGGL